MKGHVEIFGSNIWPKLRKQTKQSFIFHVLDLEKKINLQYEFFYKLFIK